MTGFIKDHRKELDSDIWLMPPLYHRTWQWLKYNVNHADNEIPMRDGTKMLIKRGQRLTSVRDVAKGVSWYEGKKYKEPNPKTISAILDWMVKTHMILITRGQSNREYTLITLIKYEEYQEITTQGNSKVTPDGEGREQLADINKNDKELLKNEKKKIIKTLYAEQVSLSEDEYLKLVEKYGSEESAKWAIDKLSNYKCSKATKYKSDYHVLIGWIFDEFEKKKLTVINGGQSNFRQSNRGSSGKKPIPIIADVPKSAPISDEERLAMDIMVELLDGASNH